VPGRQERLEGAEVGEDLLVVLEGGEDHEEQGEDGDAGGDDKAEVGQRLGPFPDSGAAKTARIPFDGLESINE